MESGAQASDCDSDETVIEGSVTENELEDEELPWRRLVLNQDTSLKSEFCFHSGVNGMWKEMPSPVIQLGLKFRKDSEEQKNKNEEMPTLSEDRVLQDFQDEATQNQVLLQTRKESPAFSVLFPHPEVSWSHRKTGGPEVENCENLPHPEKQNQQLSIASPSLKELSKNTDFPEISLLSGTSLMTSDLVTLKEKSLEPVKTLAVPSTFSDTGKEVSLIMTSKETKDEESSLETFVSALERLLESPDGTQEETLEIVNDFNLQELTNPLSSSLSSVSVPLNALPTCYRDALENKKDHDALPAELLGAINALPGADVGPGLVGPICQGQEKNSSVSDGNGCLEVQPTMSHIDEDCTQIAQTIEDPKPFRLQIMTHENGTSYEQLNNEGNSEPVENTSVQETPHVLRRSARLQKLKASRAVTHTDVTLKIPEETLSKLFSYEDSICSIHATENFRMQDSVLMTDSKRKNIHSSRFKSEQIQKNEQLKIKDGKRKMNEMYLCSINRRNIFGENLLYKAALHNDIDLIRCCIKNGGNVNQPSYAGWTALHEASVGGYYQTVSELLKGGADVNVKGKYQITPLHDAVMNGHYKVAELLLLNGADPLFVSDHGICALDEAQDSFMENLLRKFIPKHKKCHLSDQRRSTDAANAEDIFQYKENELKAGSLTTCPQKEAVNYCDSKKTSIYEQHIPNYEQYIHGIAFDHSCANSEDYLMPCTGPPSTHEVTQVTGQVELLKAFQNNAHREPTPLVNKADTYNVEKKQDTEKNYVVKDQNPSSSNSPLHTVVHSQVIEITTAEKRTQDLPGNKPVDNTHFHSIDNVNKELANSSQLNQGEEKEIAHKSDEELTDNTSTAERTVRNCKEKGETVDSETHMPGDTQEHRQDQNFRKRKGSLEAPCSQVTDASTDGIKKRNAKGESQLHLASREGNLSLVKVLIESGADVNLKDNAGWTALHEASSEGFSDVIRELLEAGAHVNCESMDGTLPLHAAAAGNRLKAAEILLERGANPNQKNQKQRTALEEADDEKMKELLKSYGAVETSNGNEISSAVTVKHPAVRTKRYKSCSCDDEKTIDPPSPLHKVKRSESLPAHQTVSAILQDIEEKQENLLKFEIRNSEDAEQYIGRMLEIKEVMDNILAQQKTERDDLAKKYRVSVESFKHGALREQLANLATRQKSLLVVAKKQKKIRLKIQNYKNAKPFSGISLRKLPSSSDISSKKSQESPGVEKPAHPQSGSLSPVCLASISPVSRSTVEIQKDSQNSNICLDAEAMERGGFSGNEMNSKENVQGCTLDGLLSSRYSVGTEKIKISSKPVAFIPQGGNSQEESSFTETIVRGYSLDSSPAVTGTVNISEDKRVFSQNDACLPTVRQNQDLSRCYPKRSNKKTASQTPSGGASEPLARQVTTVLDTDTVQQTKPCPKKTASVNAHENSLQISPSSGSANQHSIKTPSRHSTTAKKKNMRLKDLILLGRINPGNNILEFKTQETTHKASVLLSGKLKVENGQIYQNPVSWLKDLLGGGNYVTWNYAWSKVTYLGKELLKYVSEVPVSPEPHNTPQQQQPCPPGTPRKSMQSIPHYLQIKEILLISDQELLPCHVMEHHWKFYVNCKKLPF